MEGIRDLRKYFRQKQSTSKPKMIASGTTDASQAELEIVENEKEKAVKPRKQYNKDISEVIKKEVGRYALIHGTKAASDCFNEKCSKCTSVRTSIDNCIKQRWGVNLTKSHLKRKVARIC